MNNTFWNKKFTTAARTARSVCTHRVLREVESKAIYWVTCEQALSGSKSAQGDVARFSFMRVSTMTKAYCAVLNKESMCVKEERKCDKPSLNLVANAVPVYNTKSRLRGWLFCPRQRMGESSKAMAS